jgi:hypothetical protein
MAHAPRLLRLSVRAARAGLLSAVRMLAGYRYPCPSGPLVLPVLVIVLTLWGCGLTSAGQGSPSPTAAAPTATATTAPPDPACAAALPGGGADPARSPPGRSARLPTRHHRHRG